MTAVLGPTNTGKTHYAIERMLAHPSGVIGLPLRLLAREVYNRIADRAGAESVALVTGEERIKPPHPRYWVATVEAMPRDLDVSFLALDEVQLAADLDRGHVFTDRLLNARGRDETLVLGAATMRGAVEKLLPGVSIVARPRLSQLTFAGEKKMTRLPKRSAIVAFSTDEVYAIAELIRRQRGGAAVVLGALSPRTRNAQVALYQSGEVDYLVATDAIGMGLNLDVDHVAFAGDRKFDGFQFRRLNPAEFAQIAGRAGRHLRDGTFGTTGRCPAFENELVQKLESHSFDPVRVLQWRNAELDFSSLRGLIDSLAVPPRAAGLTRAPGADDVLALEHAARDPEIGSRIGGEAEVRLLWEVCQLPDYRRIAPAQHSELIATLFGFLRKGGKIPDAWFERQVAATDRTDGDIDTLSARIAHIRTWTFVATRAHWLESPEHWQARTRSVEDRLSDALHERLTQRFVDRRTSVLMRRLRDRDMLEAEILPDGEVRVGGHLLGRLAGFQFTADPGADAEERQALRAAAAPLLAGQIESRARRLATAPDGEIVLASDGHVRWLGEVVARLAAGDKPLVPRLRITADEQLSGPSREIVEQRLDAWLKAHVTKLLGPLQVLETAPDLEGIGRGIAFQIVEQLGVLDRTRVTSEVRELDQTGRSALRKHGVRFGAYHLYLPLLMKPAPRALAAQIWSLHHGRPDEKGADDVVHLAASGRTSIPADKEIAKGLYRTLGFKVAGERAVRVDILERLADLIRPAVAYKPGLSQGAAPPGAADGDGFTVTVAMTSLVGCSGEDFASVLRALGYRMERRLVPPPPPDPPQASDTPIAGEPAADAGGTPDQPAGGDRDAVPAPDTAASAQAERVAEDRAEPDPAEAAEPGPSEAEAAGLRTTAPDADAGGAAAPGPVEGEAAEAAAGESLPAAETGAPEADAIAVDALAVAAIAVAATASADAPAEPVYREVWHMARFERPSGEGRHRRPDSRNPDNRNRGWQRPAQAAAPATEASAEPAAPESRTEQPRRDRQHRRDRPDRGDFGKRSGTRNRNDDRPPPTRGPGRDERADVQPVERPQRKPERAPDPDSPFAALLALKSTLEAQKKDRR